ncbi:hypothetical protein GF378_01040 [Candidatus Pacearchaeota archaeon]|nr:hypothetical protein [Candidatus Pacearchaeota archaeon]
MSKKVNSVTEKVLARITPPKEDLKFIKDSLKEFISEFKKEIKKQKVNANAFVGGSFAKDTMIKKDVYDIDVFVRFSKEYDDKKLSKLLEKILNSMDTKGKSVEKIHGSRDYFRIKMKEDFFIELVPVAKITNPKQARNITDLSYSHVRYVKNKLKSKEKLKDDIKIAKAFCYGSKTYGAESYINGFSGYALELLIYSYKGFVKFIKAMSNADIGKNKEKDKKDKIIIDIEKHYKNKKRILMDINASKLGSPIILIDPTYKQRNALAALSYNTFRKFQKACKKFLKNPSEDAFIPEKINVGVVKENAKKKGNEFIEIEAETNKQVGDIAGSKLLKFFRHLKREISRYFDIKESRFEYSKAKTGRYIFTAKSKEEVIIEGPFKKDKKSVQGFKKAHKKADIFEKKDRIYAKEKIDFALKGFIQDWKKEHKQRMKDMSITDLRIKK